MKVDLNFFSNAISEVKILKKRRKQTSGEAFPDVRILDVQNWKCFFSNLIFFPN